MSRYGRPEWLDQMPTVGASRNVAIPVDPPAPRAEVEIVEDRAPVTREYRDPTAATRSLQYVSPGRAVPPDWNATKAFEVAVYSNVVVYACFQAIANAISSLPFRVGPDPDRPTDYNVNAPLARLLGPPPGGPNPGMSAEELWHFLIVQYLATGRLGAEIETAAGSSTPAALWPLVSSYLCPIPTTSGTAWWKAFEYGRPSDERRLAPESVFYAWKPRGTDFRQPESALEAAGLDVSIAVMQSRYDYAFLKNDARPAAIVVTEQFEDEESYAAFKAQWEGAHRGPGNAGKTAFVESLGGGERGVTGAVDVKVLGFSPKDAQAAQRYAERLQQIAIALGVPWSRLDASGRTFANASEEDRIFWQQTLLPLMRRLQSAVNIQLAPRLGSDVGWFDISGVKVLTEKADPITAQVGAPAMVQAQLMTINEARADYGLPPLPDGDRLMTADEITALRGGPPVDAAARSAVPEVRAVAEVPSPAAPSQESAPPAPPPEDRGETVEEIEARRTKVWTTTDAAVRNLERAVQRAFEKLFARQLRSVLARLEAKRGRQARAVGEVRALADEVFDPRHWLTETLDEARTLYERIADSAGQKMASRFGIAFDLDAPFVEDFVKSRANQLAGNVTDTTYAAIQDALSEGIAEGESIPDLSARIRHVFDVASTSRATTIARTETISAYNGAAASVASSYGNDVVAGQEWIATRDSRVREQHAERDGERVPIGEPFSGGLAYPGDPSGDPGDVINCRCTVAFLTPDEFGQRSVPVGIARAVLGLARYGVFDERLARQVIRHAA